LSCFAFGLLYLKKALPTIDKAFLRLWFGLMVCYEIMHSLF
jgi:hypothetical protein